MTTALPPSLTIRAEARWRNARTLVAAVCAVSAGIHAALVPDHLHEAGPRLASAFAVSAALLAIAATLVRNPGHHPWPVAFAVGVLTANVLAYLLSRTAGLPGLIPQPEQLDLLGLVTTTAEVVGVAAGVALIARKGTTAP